MQLATAWPALLERNKGERKKMSGRTKLLKSINSTGRNISMSSISDRTLNKADEGSIH